MEIKHSIWTHLLTLSALVFIGSNSMANTQQLEIPGSMGATANFPCNAEKVKSQTATGHATSLQCSILVGQSFCNFLITDSDLDPKEFKKSGFNFIKQIHHQYGLALDSAYVSKRAAVIQLGQLGNALEFELHHGYQGHIIRARGYWLPYEQRLLRISTSCTPVRSDIFQREQSLFFSSFGVAR